MAIPAGPYTLVASTPLEITPTTSQHQRFKSVVLANLSAYVCGVYLQNGPSVWLKPWSAHAYDISDLEAYVRVTPQTSIAPTFVSGTLTVDWIELDDPDPPTASIGLFSPNVSQSGPLGEIVGTDFNATGLPGATAGARFVGGTISGPPTTGSFQPGDFAVDQSGAMWVYNGTTWSTWPPPPRVPIVGSGRWPAAQTDFTAFAALGSFSFTTVPGRRYLVHGYGSGSVVTASSTQLLLSMRSGVGGDRADPVNTIGTTIAVGGLGSGHSYFELTNTGAAHTETINFTAATTGGTYRFAANSVWGHALDIGGS